MYSKTYPTPEDYVENAPESYWLVAAFDDQSVRTCQVDEPDALLITTADASETAAGTVRGVLARCFPDVGTIRTVIVEQARHDIDWVAGRQLGTRRIRVAGPV